MEEMLEHMEPLWTEPEHSAADAAAQTSALALRRHKPADGHGLAAGHPLAAGVCWVFCAASTFT